MIAEPVEPPDLFALPVAEPEPEPPASLRDLAYAAWQEAQRMGGPEWDTATPEERAATIASRIMFTAGAAESLARAGYTGSDALASYLRDAMAVSARNDEPGAPVTFPEPEDRGTAVLSDLGGVEYVEDLIRPGRIVTWAAEEGSGKSYAVGGELAVRVAVAGGSFAGTWPVLQTGPVLYLSEMHADDDYGREATVLSSLGLDRSALAGRYYRLPLMTAAGGRPALTVPEWRTWATAWTRDHGALLLIVDTATGATQVDPWGREIQAVYAALRVMLAEYPDLAIVLLIHLKKPQGRGDRRISDVLGEWGRWCDVVVIQENDGNGLARARLTVRKRVRRAIGVSKDTASRYVQALGGQVATVKGAARGVMQLYRTAAPPHTAAQEACGDDAATDAAEEAPQDVRPPHRRSTCIGAAVVRAAVPADSPDLVAVALDIFGDVLVDGAS